MCKAIEEMREDAREEGRGGSVCNLMKNLSITMGEAMNALEIPKSDRERYVKLV